MSSRNPTVPWTKEEVERLVVWMEENPEELRGKQAARWYLLLYFTACTMLHKPCVKNKVVERRISGNCIVGVEAADSTTPSYVVTKCAQIWVH